MDNDEYRAIAAILASYAYNDFQVVNSDLKIGKNKKFYFNEALSTPDIWVWEERPSNNPEVFVAFRGTSHFHHVAKTWIPIGLGLERIENKYIPYVNHFTQTTEHIEGVLKSIPNDKMFFTGHSLGGTNARLQVERFSGARGFTFNAGQGILTNKLTNKLLKSFLFEHIGRLAKIVTPHLLPYVGETITEGVVLLTKEVVKGMIRNYTAFSNYANNPNLEHYRQDMDLVSGLAGYNNYTKNLPSKGYNPLSAHEMGHLVDTVKNMTGYQNLDVETIKEAIHDIDTHHKYTHFHLLMDGFNVPTARVNVSHVDLLGRKNIRNTIGFVRASRANYRRNVNPFLY